MVLVLAMAGDVLAQAFVLPRRTPGETYRDPRPPFSVLVDSAYMPLSISVITARPGQKVSVNTTDKTRVFRLEDRHRSYAGDSWSWMAPESPGITGFRIISENRRDSVSVVVLVLRPFSEMKRGRLDGYRIGTYTSWPRRRGRRYRPPDGLVPVPPEMESVLVSPNHTIGQFLCKQPGEPRYATVSLELTVKLEAVLVSVRESGYGITRLAIMSGYRTPYYNASIGNRTSLSRHLWGDAADIYIDGDNNGEMDDLNNDGRVDYRDADMLADIVEKTVKGAAVRIEPGGLKVYRRNAVRGPFVHVDARGKRARW